MRVALAVALLALGCRIDLSKRDPPDAAMVDEGRMCKTTETAKCVEAVDHSDLAWIESNIFSVNCGSDTCHSQPSSGQPPSGKLVLEPGVSHMTLLGAGGTGVMSAQDGNHRLVTPGSKEMSYLYFIMKGAEASVATPAFQDPDDSVGFMPMNNNTLCCQKIDAIGRWIDSGAPM